MIFYMNYFAKGRFLNLLFLDFRMVSNAFIDCPVSIAVELATARMMRAFSCLLLAKTFVFMMNSISSWPIYFISISHRVKNVCVPHITSFYSRSVI